MRGATPTILIPAWLAACVLAQAAAPAHLDRQIQFVFTSDAHYGITRAAFRGGDHQRQWTPGAIREHALFCAIFSAIGWIGANAVAAHAGFAQPSICGLPLPFNLPKLVAFGE